MHPQSPRLPALLLTATLLFLPQLRAQQDAPAIDTGKLLQDLRVLREQVEASAKGQKLTAVQQLAAAAGSTERAVQLWEEAIRATQFDGMAKEGAQFRAWKEGEGEALKEREVQSAVHLHLSWLVLTLQRSAGAKMKEMLPAVVNYTKELVNDEAAMETLVETMKREKEAAALAPPGGGNRRNQNPVRKVNEGIVKRVHDQILNPALAASPVVRWMKLTDAMKVEQWEKSPGDLDGIFKNIILPELRAQKDARVLEYWDLKLKKEAETASRTKLAFAIEQFNGLRRPTLLWGRAQEFLSLDQRNRAVTEMFTLIKTYPAHPEADDWIGELEKVLAPPAPAAAAGVPVPGALPGS